MLILSLDLGIKCGWALGVAGSSASVTSGTRILRTGGAQGSEGLGALLDWLNKMWADKKIGPPNVVAKEAPLSFVGFARQRTSALVIESQLKLHGVVEAMADYAKIPCYTIARQTVMKHFVGVGNLKRAEGKLAAIRRAQLLGYIPKDCMDEDRADALALWDYAGAKYGRASGGTLQMFQDVA